MCAFRPPPCRVLGHVFEGSLLDLVCICRNRSRNVRRPAQTEAVTSGRVSKPKPLATLRVQSEAAGHDAQARRSRRYYVRDQRHGTWPQNERSGSRIRRVSEPAVRCSSVFASVRPLNACPPEGPEALQACSLFQGTKAWLEPRLGTC